MTDITELAQSLKAAAEKATPGNWRAFQYHDGRCGVGGGNHDEIMVCEHISKKRPHDALFIAMANPANILALVEALERAQSANEYLREQSAEWERKAISNFEDCAEMSARIEELESQRKLAFAASNRWADKFREAEQRIAELESRSVKLPAERFCPAEYAGSQLWSETEVWNKAITACADELRASGIKVEAE
ncbi:TPA: ead/Ea22-like family protein [Klebsiella quasipneumoniae]|uniref:ead/Ea22-like family protein n=1 Tax=Klebsiella quasipneumoniae TaxID=1463165 RepID=UPI0021F360B4|nr:ead/Ea22-like family protein [Klebsiella quasipneumoniae]WJU40446.1 ead/Ea22-like family protein [Klebsiella pneumoniae]